MSQCVFVCKCVKEQAKERERRRGGDADGETMSVEILQLKSGDFRYSRQHFGHDGGCTQLSDPDGAVLITFRVFAAHRLFSNNKTVSTR